MIPSDYFGSPKLSRLQARAEIHPGQIEVVPLLKADPNANFLFCGRNGSGKSHFIWALYRNAIAHRRRAVVCSLNDLLRQFRSWELMSPEARSSSRQERPMILPRDLIAIGKQTVIIEEFEKAAATEFASRTLFELLNAVRDYGHQLLVTSNYDWIQLREHWSRVDEVYGNSIMTRLAGCKLVELF